MPLLLLSLARPAAAQLMQPKAAFTRADSLRGGRSALRTCYDINYYHLDVKLDVADRAISGTNLFRFTATQDFTRLQFDLFANLKVDKVTVPRPRIALHPRGQRGVRHLPGAHKERQRDEFTVAVFAAT
ncbi:MAG: hypothetical protein WKG07_35125 [Hymenobacter sp.]